jgi:hypothetical protein
MLKKVRVNDAATELRMARFKWMWKTNSAARFYTKTVAEYGHTL